MPGKVSNWLPDDLWERVSPLLPKPRRRRTRYPGRKPLNDRNVLTGIIFVLRTGIPWREMPAELGCGDTIEVLHNGKAERTRVAGIDCPEKHQPFGNKTKQFTSASPSART